MNRNEFELFKALNEALKKEGVELKIICVGGFVLSHYGMRTTLDIDGFFENSKKINRIIKAVGDKYGINRDDELWLNNSVQNMNRIPPETICEKYYDFSNLKVLVPPLEYIAGMKLTSARQQDIEDVGWIIRKQQIESPEDFLKELEGYGFGNVDESVLLESFGHAYGMKWLEEYFIANEELINERIKER